MKITLIGPSHPYKGGIAHYNMLLAQALGKNHEVDVISFSRMYPKLLYPGKEQRDEASSLHIGPSSLELLDTINPFTWWKTFRHIKKNSPDAVLFYWWTPYFFANFGVLSRLISWFTSAKVFYLCHNPLPHERRPVDRILTKFALKKSEYFIVHSTECKDTIVNIFPDVPVAVGVHPTYDVFNQGTFDVKAVRKELDLTSKTLLFFGYVRKYKGLQHLLRAMPAILKKHPDVRLLVVGEFWGDKQDYLDMIAKYKLQDVVRIVDSYVPNEEVGKYFSVSDLVVLPYESATNSGIVQTSFGFEVPVLVTAVGGLPEVVTDGVSGLVVPPQDPKAIAEAVVRFYDKKLLSKFKKGIESEKERFSWDRIVELIEAGLR